MSLKRTQNERRKKLLAKKLRRATRIMGKHVTDRLPQIPFQLTPRSLWQRSKLAIKWIFKK